MKKFFIAPLIALMAGCASAPPRTVEVRVPVSVPCKAPAVEAPDWSLNHVAPGAGLFAQVQAMIAELEQRRAYEAELEAAARACQ